MDNTPRDAGSLQLHPGGKLHPCRGSPAPKAPGHWGNSGRKEALAIQDMGQSMNGGWMVSGRTRRN